MEQDVSDIYLEMWFPENNSLKLPFWIVRKAAQALILMWISSYCISGVFQWHAKQKMSYHVYNGSEPKKSTESIFRRRFCYLIVLKQSMKLHFLDVYVNYQTLKGNK